MGLATFRFSLDHFVLITRPWSSGGGIMKWPVSLSTMGKVGFDEILAWNWAKIRQHSSNLTPYRRLRVANKDLRMHMVVQLMLTKEFQGRSRELSDAANAHRELIFRNPRRQLWRGARRFGSIRLRTGLRMPLPLQPLTLL